MSRPRRPLRDPIEPEDASPLAQAVSQRDRDTLAMVTRAEVGHVVATLQACGRQHTFVVDRNVAGRQIICGVFSATQIARQLGAPVHAGEIARTFAEIEAVIAGS